MRKYYPSYHLHSSSPITIRFPKNRYKGCSFLDFDLNDNLDGYESEISQRVELLENNNENLDSYLLFQLDLDEPVEPSSEHQDSPIRKFSNSY